MTFTIPFDTYTITVTVIVSIVVVNLLLWGIFILYAKFGNLRPHLQGFVRWIDEFCDGYTNPEKKQKAIDLINDFLGWRKILIPKFLVGWAVDAEVFYLHKICPDVHTAAIQQITADGVQAVKEITETGVQAIQEIKEIKEETSHKE